MRRTRSGSCEEGGEDKLYGPYGGWNAVENAALALSESANLLMIPGRLCMNGKPMPLNRPDWPKFVAQLRAAGQAAYKAAQSKNMDNIIDVAATVTEACSACHDVYREKKEPGRSVHTLTALDPRRPRRL